MAISGKRIILANNQALRAKDQNGDVQELLKLDGSGQISGKVKDYIDAQNVIDQGEIDTLNTNVAGLDARMGAAEGLISNLQQTDTGLQSQIGTLQDRALALENADGAMDVRVDTLETQMASKAEQSAVTAVDQRVDSLDGSLVALTGRVSDAETAIANLASSSAITELDGRLDVLEPKVSTLESEMDQAQADITSLQSGMAAKASQADLDDIEAYAQDIRDDHDALELTVAGKLDASQKGAANGVAELDATGKVPAAQLPVVQSVSAHKMAPITLSAQQVADGYIDLSHEAMSGSISVFCERMAILEGLDYSVSSSGGVSRLTWSGPSAAGGEEAFAEGDIVYVQYLRSL